MINRRMLQCYVMYDQKKLSSENMLQKKGQVITKGHLEGTIESQFINTRNPLTMLNQVKKTCCSPMSSTLVLT